MDSQSKVALAGSVSKEILASERRSRWLGALCVSKNSQHKPARAMNIKIATWNMAYWSHQNFLDEAWNFFLNSVDADFYFFQEGRSFPQIIEDGGHMVWSEIGGHRNWGSGIYSKKYLLVEEKIETNYNGVFSIANTETGGTKFTLISLYGLLTDTYSITNLHRILSDLTPIFNGHIDGKRNIILGGDLNASLQCDKIQNNNSHKIFFERLEDFKLKDCFKLTNKKFPVQTLRHHTSQDKWQNDYFFISNTLSKKLIGCEVIDNEQVRKFSDHNPVIISLKI